MKITKVLIASALGVPVFLQSACVHAESISSSTSSTSQSSTHSSYSSSEIAFQGSNNSMHRINGDRLEVRNGVLFVNGVSYGKVHDASEVKYSVRDNEKILTVDGVVRQPLR